MFVNIWMKTDVITMPPNGKLGEALRLFKENKIRRLPIVDEEALVGILVPADIERVLPSILDAEGADEVEYIAGNTEVKTVMVASPITVTAEDSLVEAARKMRENKIDGLPVVDGNKLIGIISITNVLDAFLEVMETRKSGTRFDLKIDHNPESFYRMIKVFKRQDKEILAIFQHNEFSRDSQLITIQTADKNNDELIDSLWGAGVTVEKVTPVS